MFMQAILRQSSVPVSARVLVIDDDPEVIRLVSDVFFELGIDMASARTIGEAWSVLPEFRPTLVLTGLSKVHEMTLAVLEAIRAWSATAPVVLLTRSSDAIRWESGFAAVLKKPVSVAELRDVVERFSSPMPTR
jgi:CheY-like chemotaxis protein